MFTVLEIPLTDLRNRFSITNISANSKPKTERPERLCKASNQNIWKKSENSIHYHVPLTLSYSSKINSYKYHQRVFPSLKITPWYVIRGQCCPFSRMCDSPLQIVMAVWRPFCLNLNFLGRVWLPSADNNGAPNSHYYLQRAVTLTRSLSRIVCRGQEGPYRQ
jgi:hypothetical protein